MKRKKRKTGRSVLCVLLAAVFIFSGYMIFKELYDRKKEKDDFALISDLVKVNSSGSKHKRDIEKLIKKNGDCIGWICVPDTQLSYPVVHTPNDPQKYLRKNLDGKYSIAGVPFLDYRCTLDSTNLIIYGHNMYNDTMFGSLPKYLKADYRKAHPIIEFETLAGCSEYTIFAIVTGDKYDNWYNFINAVDEADYAQWLDSIKNRAVYCSDTLPAYGSQLLTLSTCHGRTKADRLLIIAAKT